MVSNAIIEIIPIQTILEKYGISIIRDVSQISILSKTLKTEPLTNCIFNKSNLINTEVINASIEKDLYYLSNKGYTILNKAFISNEGIITYIVA